MPVFLYISRPDAYNKLYGAQVSFIFEKKKPCGFVEMNWVLLLISMGLLTLETLIALFVYKKGKLPLLRKIEKAKKEGRVVTAMADRINPSRGAMNYEHVEYVCTIDGVRERLIYETDDFTNKEYDAVATKNFNATSPHLDTFPYKTDAFYWTRRNGITDVYTMIDASYSKTVVRRKPF